MTQPRDLAGYPSELDSTWHFVVPQPVTQFVVFFHTQRALTGNPARPPPSFVDLKLALMRTGRRLLSAHGIDLQESPSLVSAGDEPLPFDEDIAQDPRGEGSSSNDYERWWTGES